MGKCAKRAFENGGSVSKADQLMAEMAAKYGTTGSAQAAPVQQPAPQPQPKVQPLPQQQGITTGIVGIFKGRAAQIDKAAGYANGGRPGGGIIRGPGTPTSDSIEAVVKETGEPIKVSTEERIVSGEQGKFLESVAKTAGYESLDAMLEDGTGKPVGPTIKAGKRAAASGLSPEEEQRRIEMFSATPPTLGTGLNGMVRTNPDTNFVTGSASGVAPTPLIGRNASGIITAESAKAAMAEPMQRSGGVFGTMDLADQNNRMAKSLGYAGSDDFNKQMANRPAAAAGILGLGADGLTDIERQNEEKTRRWRQDDLISLAQRGNQGAIAAALNGDANYDAAKLRQTSDIRGQEVSANTSITNAKIADSSSSRRDAVTMRGQDISGANEAIRAGIDRDRLGIVQADSRRADEKWGVERGILQGQASDSEMVRGARAELTAALATGDQKKIDAAKAKAVAAGIKFDKPNNEYVTTTDSMGMNITRTNKDTGAVDVIEGKSGKIKSSIPGPGLQPVQAAVPPGYAVIGTSGGRRVLQDAKGNRFVEGN